MAVTHLVPNTYGPLTFGPNWSPINWSLWINGPQPILSPWTNDPPKFGPPVQMVPDQFGPPGKMVPRLFCLSKGQAVMIWKYGDQICGDHLSRGTLCPGGPNRLGTICPWGLNFLGPFVPGDREWGTVSPGIKWVWDQMTRSP